MKLTIIGCYSATPRISAHTTTQVLESRGHIFLIDCGEGTQMELRKHKVKFNQIKHIFISHLHGDHCFGLIGLISTFRLLNREADLHIYGPKGIKELIMLQMKLSKSWIDFNLIFHELTSLESELIFEDDKIEVHTIPLDHRVYTNGFLFKEKAFDRKLLVDKAEAKHIDVAYYRKLKQGADVLNSHGKLISNGIPFFVFGLVGIVFINDNEPSSVVTSILYVAVVVCIINLRTFHQTKVYRGSHDRIVN